MRAILSVLVTLALTVPPAQAGFWDMLLFRRRSQTSRPPAPAAPAAPAVGGTSATRETLTALGHYNPAFGDQAEYLCKDDASLGAFDVYQQYKRSCVREHGGTADDGDGIITTFDPGAGVCTAVVHATCTMPPTP